MREVFVGCQDRIIVTKYMVATVRVSDSAVSEEKKYLDVIYEFLCRAKGVNRKSSKNMIMRLDTKERVFTVTDMYDPMKYAILRLNDVRPKLK